MRDVGYFKKVTFDEFVKAAKETNPYLFHGETDEDFIYFNYYSKIKLPTRATIGSAGYDFFFPYDTIVIQPAETVVIPTAIAAVINPEDWFLGLYPKSGLSFNYKTKLDDTVGIIDRDYVNSENGGHIYAKITNEGDKDLIIETGAQYIQGIFQEFGIIENDNATKIRNGGFGSTYKF